MPLTIFQSPMVAQSSFHLAQFFRRGPDLKFEPHKRDILCHPISQPAYIKRNMVKIITITVPKMRSQTSLFTVRSIFKDKYEREQVKDEWR